MKKVLTLVLVLIMGVAIVACGNSTAPDVEEGNGDTEEKQFDLIGGINLPTTHPYYLGMRTDGRIFRRHHYPGSIPQCSTR